MFNVKWWLNLWFYEKRVGVGTSLARVEARVVCRFRDNPTRDMPDVEL